MNKRYLPTFLFSILAAVAYGLSSSSFSITGPELEPKTKTDESETVVVNTGEEEEIIKSCKYMLSVKHEPTIPSAFVGSCEISLRRPNEVKEVDAMKSYVESVNSGGTFDSVKRFVMFFASGRSGHSWLGAILDASPTAMVANQRNTFADYFDEGMTREELYTALAYNSWNCGNNGW
jgi:hypothetical protein